MKYTAQKTPDPKMVRREGARLVFEDGEIVCPGVQTAKLWAAAPALLEALKRLVGNADQYLPEWDEARAAILLAGHTPGHWKLKPEVTP